MSSERNFPTITEALIVELNKRWPEQCADPQWTDREVWISAGQRSVVRFLNTVYEEQQQSVL